MLLKCLDSAELSAQQQAGASERIQSALSLSHVTDEAEYFFEHSSPGSCETQRDKGETGFPERPVVRQKVGLSLYTAFVVGEGSSLVPGFPFSASW